MLSDLPALFKNAFYESIDKVYPSRWMFDFIGNYTLTPSDYGHPLYAIILGLLEEKCGVEYSAKIMLFSLHWVLSKKNINASIIKHPYLLLLYMILCIDDYADLNKETIKKMVKVISSLEVDDASTMAWTLMQIGQTIYSTESLNILMESEHEYQKAHQKTPLVIAVAPFIADINFIIQWMPHEKGQFIGDNALKNYEHLQSPEAKMSIINLKFKPISQLGQLLKDEWLKELMHDFEQKLSF